MAGSSWVVTCDPGVDDAVALAVAAGRPDCDLRAVVAGAGNIDAPTAGRNAAGVVALLGLDVPVAVGSPVAVGGEEITRERTSHGADGLAGLSHLLPAVPAAPAPDGLALVSGDVVATGPLTDVALARRSGQCIDRVVWMGGRLRASELSAAREFNASADPDAVDDVLGSVDLTVVPLDATRQVTLGPADLDRWATGAPVARFCAALARSRIDRSGRCVLHDPVAVVAALEPALFRWSDITPPRGRAAARVASGVDAAAVRARIIEAVVQVGGG